jgi:hypothetical protein
MTSQIGQRSATATTRRPGVGKAMALAAASGNAPLGSRDGGRGALPDDHITARADTATDCCRGAPHFPSRPSSQPPRGGPPASSSSPTGCMVVTTPLTSRSATTPRSTTYDTRAASTRRAFKLLSVGPSSSASGVWVLTRLICSPELARGSRTAGLNSRSVTVHGCPRDTTPLSCDVLLPTPSV